jgi:hypothetical protein
MLIKDHVSHIRETILRILEKRGIYIHIHTVGVVKSVNTYLTFADISIGELKQYIRGYGKLPDDADEELNQIIFEIHSAINRFKIVIRGTSKNSSSKAQIGSAITY